MARQNHEPSVVLACWEADAGIRATFKIYRHFEVEQTRGPMDRMCEFPGAIKG